MNNIPIGQRIGEIFEERDISISAFVLRMKPVRVMSDTTLGRSIAGTRHLPPDELRDIAQTLKVSVDRITQRDTEKRTTELRKLKTTNPRMAVQIAQEVLPIALGWSEKVDILNDIGTAYYYLKQFEEAHEAWLQAYEYAQKIKWENERLYDVISNLILSYKKRNDYIPMIKMLENVDDVFNDDPERAGTLCYSYASYAYKIGSLDTYKKKIYESHGHFSRSGHEMNIALSAHNIAYVEYQFRNFEKSKELFEQAIKLTSKFEDFKFICIKDFSKTLLQLGEKERALDLVQNALEELATLEGHSEIRAKILLLHAWITNSVDSAEMVLTLAGISEQLYQFAYRFLVDRYIETGDVARLAKYKKQVEKYLSALSFTLEEI